MKCKPRRREERKGKREEGIAEQRTFSCSRRACSPSGCPENRDQGRGLNELLRRSKCFSSRLPSRPLRLRGCLKPGSDGSAFTSITTGFAFFAADLSSASRLGHAASFPFAGSRKYRGAGQTSSARAGRRSHRAKNALYHCKRSRARHPERYAVKDLGIQGVSALAPRSFGVPQDDGYALRIIHGHPNPRGAEGGPFCRKRKSPATWRGGFSLWVAIAIAISTGRVRRRGRCARVRRHVRRRSRLGRRHHHPRHIRRHRHRHHHRLVGGPSSGDASY